MKIRIYVVTIIAFFAAALAPQASAEPLKVRISWSVTPPHITPLLFENKSILRHYGKSYVVETVRLRGSGPALTALAANELEIAGFSYQALALGVVNAKMNLRVVSDVMGIGINGYGDDEFMARPGEIKSLKDLKGKVIAVNARGSGLDAVVRKKMLSAGFKDGQDYTIVEVGFSAMLPALESKKVDLAFFVAPFDQRAKKKGFETIFTFSEVLGPTQTLVWAAKKEWLDANREALKDFFEDALRARRWLMDPANRMRASEIIAKVTKRKPQNYSGWVFGKDDYYRSPDARPDLVLLQKNIDDFHALGLIPGTINVSKYADLSFQEEAVRRLK